MSETLDLVKALARVIRDHELAELEYEKGDLRIRLVLEAAAPPPAFLPPGFPMPMPAMVPPPAAVPVPPPAPEVAGRNAVSSPLAGVFYRSPSPGAPPFVKEGDVVAAGQTLCIVEAMKLMNEITADSACRILQVLVENATVVEPGQALFRVEPLGEG